MSFIKNAFFNSDIMNDFQATILEGANTRMGMVDIINTELQEFRGSFKRQQMLTGERYYMNNSDINFKGRKFAIPEERETLADNRLSNPFMKKLVDQKVGYLLGKPIVASSDNETYEEYWHLLMNQKFDKTIKSIGKEAINKGIGWLYVYIDEKGNFEYKKMRSEQIVPIWADDQHTDLEAVINFYDVSVYSGTEKSIVTRVEFYDKEGVHFFIYDGIQLVEDVERGVFRPHILISYVNEETNETEQGGFGWGRVPFISFNYNEEEQPLIQFLKSLVDDYDRQKSINSDIIEDTPNGLLALFGYGGESIAELKKNLAKYRLVMMEGSQSGEKVGVESVNVKADTDGYKNHMELARKDIYEFGRGVDTQGIDLGSAPSGVALKFLYSDLALDMAIMETEFQSSLLELKYFFDLYLLNVLSTEDFTDTDIEFIFNKDMPIDEAGIIESIRNSVGILSEETLIENHPYVNDVNKEVDRIKKQRDALIGDSYGSLPPTVAPSKN